MSNTRVGTLVDVGVERHILLPKEKIPHNTRVTVKIKKSEKLLEGETANRDEIPEYWGYKITRSELTLGDFLRKHPFDLIIATSKHGQPFLKISEELAKRWNTSRKVIVAFGAPTQGLYEIAKQENLNLDDITHFVVNTIPRQKVETVRTEEALFVTLGILNLMVAKG